MDANTKNVIFKIFILIVVLVVSYFAYLEIKRLMVARKIEKRIEKAEKKVGELFTSIQDADAKDAP